MTRERDGAFADLVLVVRQNEVPSGTIDLLMVVHQDPIVDDRHVSGTNELAIGKDRSREKDIEMESLLGHRKGKGGQVVLSSGKEIMVSASQKANLLAHFQ